MMRDISATVDQTYLFGNLSSEYSNFAWIGSLGLDGIMRVYIVNITCECLTKVVKACSDPNLVGANYSTRAFFTNCLVQSSYIGDVHPASVLQSVYNLSVAPPVLDISLGIYDEVVQKSTANPELALTDLSGNQWGCLGSQLLQKNFTTGLQDDIKEYVPASSQMFLISPRYALTTDSHVIA